MDMLNIHDVSTSFIGLSDREIDTQFIWEDGSPLTFQNWNADVDRPNGQTDFIYMGNWSGGKWYTTSFWTSKNYVCELSCNTIPSNDNGLSLNQMEGPENGSLLEVGTYTISYEVVNACGDVANCSFEVIVNPPANCAEEEIEGFVSLDDFQAHQYQLSEEKERWVDAEEICMEQGGYLAIVESAEENEFLRTSLNAQGISTAYIGLSDVAGDGSFQWWNGQSPSFTNWSTSPATNNSDDFVYMGSWSNGSWYFGNTYTEKNFVCEFECSNFPETQGLQVAGSNGSAQVFPNPVIDQLQFSFEDTGFNAFSLTDVSGRVISRISFDQEQYFHELDMSQLQEGIYFLRVQSKALGILSFKLVKAPM